MFSMFVYICIANRDPFIKKGTVGMAVISQDLDFHRHMSNSFLVFNDLKKEVVVSIVDIDRIVDHY
jgi:hypothetical protein